MTRIAGLGIALFLCGAANAAPPPAPAPAVRPHEARPSTTTPATPTSKPDAIAPARKPLDLRVGDVRNYMLPSDFQAALAAPDPDKNTIVVHGTRLVPMERIEDVPPGLASLWYAAKHPLNAWRLLAPVVHGPELEKPSPVPPPVFRWGP